MSDADHKQAPDARKTDGESLSLSWDEDGQPFSEGFGDHFYSKNDGRAECGHVFINANALPSRFAAGGTIRIGELGFGTGLNFCETYRQWKAARLPGAMLEFTSFERYPLKASDIDRALSRWIEIDSERDALVRLWPPIPSATFSLSIDDQTRLTISCGDALEQLSRLDQTFNAWFLDGFAPSRNPDMWSEDLLRHVFRLTADGGTFGTYTAAGFVRRNLAAAGFIVERLPGFAGKREMLAGRRCNATMPK
ncbi:tRNA (5-methylaminomethyl-2-thiouridine)(34)-methyltransferase MnmD [Martelella alba]|uniref:tRNA (5-methylaminomethyl-2-thiouridine)(34)-methyltransferase MnmD n=1 Tax=Martelella alba TaxID=2590451 RepID=A0A506UFB7_9HYPH|nr:tRNA (5-methylaminomethyl-2-thiouridine)(34)-methyltransferase MnmD [Martelella alba]TPW31645.1 tRNA (5-methylaminomethyl-2-thiouridine)(34)-methyltransferase MnmD [Martelella alba]